MSMLADRKSKMKWSDDPNGLRWAKDTNSFGRKMLEKMGWQGGGLGKCEEGKQEFVKVAVKNDTSGVGCVQKTDREHLISVAGGLDDVLSALRANSADSATVQVSSRSFSLVEASKERGTRFHYRRMVAAKDVRSRINEVIISANDTNSPALSLEAASSKKYFTDKFKSRKVKEGEGASDPSCVVERKRKKSKLNVCNDNEFTNGETVADTVCDDTADGKHINEHKSDKKKKKSSSGDE